MKKLQEAKEIQKVVENKKKLPKKFRVNNELVEIDYSFRTKLEELSDEEAIELLKASLINGREGFFCLKSNRDLTLEKALETYREKDSIEKIFHSLKNEINIKPLRVWSDDSIYGAIILGFIAQLFISLMRYCQGRSLRGRGRSPGSISGYIYFDANSNLSFKILQRRLFWDNI